MHHPRRIRKKTRCSERNSSGAERKPTFTRKMTINPMLVQKAVFVKKSNTGPDEDKPIASSKGGTAVRFNVGDTKRELDKGEDSSEDTSEEFNYTLTKIHHIKQEDFKAEDIRIMNANSKYNSYRLSCNRCAITVFIVSLVSMFFVVLDVFLQVS